MTQKIKLGVHVFREKPTNEKPDPVEKACIVIAKNDDGTAKLTVFDPDGSQFILDRAELVQTCDEVDCHYEEASNVTGQKPGSEGVHLRSKGEEIREGSPL